MLEDRQEAHHHWVGPPEIAHSWLHCLLTQVLVVVVCALVRALLGELIQGATHHMAIGDSDVKSAIIHLDFNVKSAIIHLENAQVLLDIQETLRPYV